MAQLVVAVAGAAVGSFFGAPQIGFAIGSAIGGALFAPKPPGPKLQDLKATAVEYGATLPLIYGHPRVGGAIIWSSDKIPVKGGGGGGKGGPSAPATITYKQNVLYKLSANPCDGVRKIFDAGKLIWTMADDATDEDIINSANTDEWEAIEIFSGADDQLPWSVYEAAVGVGRAPANRGQLTVGITGLSLGQSGYPRQLTFEIARSGTVVQSEVGLFIDAPFDSGPDDFGPAPAASTSQSSTDGTLSYGGSILLEADPGDPVDLIYSGSKLESGPFSIITSELRGVSVVSFIDISGSESGQYFFRIDTGPASNLFEFAFLMNGSGIPQVRAIYRLSGSGSFVSTTIGDFVPGDYKIVRDGSTGNALWIINDSVVHTVGGFGSVFNPGRVLLRCGQFSGTRAVTAWSADRLLTYTDTFVEADITRVAANPDSLQYVLEDLSLRCGLEDGYTDASACADIEVEALAITQVTPARNVIESILFPAYSATCFEDDGLTYVLRGGTSVATLTYDDLGATEGDPSGDPLPIVDRTDIEVPAQYAITSSDIYNDYQNQTSYSDILSGSNSGVATGELAIGLTPQAAKRVADIKIRQAYLARRQIGPVGLTKEWSKLRPTDLVTFTGSDGSTFLGFITKITDSGPVRTVELELDDASVWVSTALADNTDNSSTIVRKVELTEALYLDIPILRDADNDAGAYVAVAPESTTGRWPGCAIDRGLSDTGYVEQLQIDSRTVIGVTTTILGDWDGLYVTDNKNTVTVTLSGAASSYTDEAIINGTAPYWVIGDEVVYVRTATLVTGTTYTLSGIYRARRGTEYATGAHEVGERVALMQTSGVRRLPFENGQLGVEFSFKAVTFGKNRESADEVLFANMGVGLKPFAPVDLAASDNGDGTYDVTWLRRTRLSTRFTGPLGINAPLGETTEAYAVDVFDGVDVTSTQTVATNAATVTAMPGDTVRVYQLSSIVGRGFVAEIEL